jgi:hypothetical protein
MEIKMKLEEAKLRKGAIYIKVLNHLKRVRRVMMRYITNINNLQWQFNNSHNERSKNYE